MSNEALTDLRALVNEQAEEEGLWFIADTVIEAFFQQELRKLHAAVERALASLPEGAPNPDSIDAKRYRWLRDHYSSMLCSTGREGASISFQSILYQPKHFTPDMLDQAIDGLGPALAAIDEATKP